MDASRLAYREPKRRAPGRAAEELKQLVEAAVQKFLADQVNKDILENYLDHAYTEPVRQFARKRGLSPTTVYAWLRTGELESFLEGNRRHIILASYDRLVRKRIAQQRGGTRKLPSSNPRVTAAPASAERALAQQRHRAPTLPLKNERNTGGRG
jgi:hypothetical protein